VLVILSGLLLGAPEFVPAPDTGSRQAIAVSIAGFVGAAALSKRHLDLAAIARNSQFLLIPFSYSLVGASSLMWLGATPFSVGFWLSRLFAIVGVLLGSIGALVFYRQSDRVRPFIAPILQVDPRSALEVSLEPCVQQFAMSLDDNDPVARGHVLRTVELAAVVGTKMKLHNDVMRDLGLVAFLHDIGKLLIPDVLLQKAAPLSDDEYRLVQRHTIYGAQLLEESTTLVSVASAVRSHHEYIDGSGYPTGQLGSQISITARIVSACDAYDALANCRNIRTSVSIESAIEVLEQHAGSRWDRKVVEILARTVRSKPPKEMPEHMDLPGNIGCDCLPHFAEAA